MNPVARMSEATSGTGGPAYRFAHASYSMVIPGWHPRNAFPLARVVPLAGARPMLWYPAISVTTGRGYFSG